MSPFAFGHLHGPGHVAHVVDGVKDAEDVNAVALGQHHEFLNDVVGIVLVADDVLAAQQHLEGGVGHLFLQLADALPGVLVEEAHGRVKGGPAPHLHRVIAHLVQLLGDGQHVVGAHPRGQQGLVRVAQDGVGDFDWCGFH